VLQRRQYRRVRLRLPVRLRWVAPLGQQFEQAETLNASRGGLLLTCHEHHGVGMPLWITFPYDPTLPEGQPEVPARVMRCEDRRENGAVMITLAIHFESALRLAPDRAGGTREEAAAAAARRPLSLSIRLRPESVPWFEEVMTLEVSPDSLRFVTNRVYARGDLVRVSFASLDSSPWRGDGEQAARVVSVDQMPGSAAFTVTIQRVSS
jgi:hypothetical protein